MSTEIQLTEEEKQEILAKREEKKAKGQLRQEAYDKNVADQIAYKQGKLDEAVARNKALADAYTNFHAELNAVNPNYKLVTEKVEFSEKVEVQKLEFIDDDGKDIWKDENGELLSSSTTKETIKTLTAKGVSSSIKYVGSEVPEDHSYRVGVDVTDNGGRYRTNLVYKMQYKGTNVDWTDGNRKYTRAKTVNEKIIQHVNWAIAKLEQEDATKVLNRMALAKAKAEYPNSAVQIKEYYIRRGEYTKYMVQVVLDNGIIVNLYIYKDENASGGVRFEVKEIENKSKVDVNGLIGALAKIPTKEA